MRTAAAHALDAIQRRLIDVVNVAVGTGFHRVGRTEQGEHRYFHRGGQMNRPGIAAEQQIAAANRFDHFADVSASDEGTQQRVVAVLPNRLDCRHIVVGTEHQEFDFTVFGPDCLEDLGKQLGRKLFARPAGSRHHADQAIGRFDLEAFQLFEHFAPVIRLHRHRAKH